MFPSDDFKASKMSIGITGSGQIVTAGNGISPTECCFFESLVTICRSINFSFVEINMKKKIAENISSAIVQKILENVETCNLILYLKQFNFTSQPVTAIYHLENAVHGSQKHQNNLTQTQKISSYFVHFDFTSSAEAEKILKQQHAMVINSMFVQSQCS